MSTDKLRAYVKSRLPILDKRMVSFAMDDVRQVLNAATGLMVYPSEPKAESCMRFIRTLEAAEKKGLLHLVVLPRALKVADRIIAEKHIGKVSM